MNRLLVVKGGDTFDVSELVETVRWGGRKNAAPRTLSATLLDDDTRDRAGIDVEEGHRCIYFADDAELFQGIFMEQQQGKSKKMTVTAYDAGIYLVNNKDTYMWGAITR